LKVASRELPNVPDSRTVERAKKSFKMGESNESAQAEKAIMKSSAQKYSTATKLQPAEGDQLLVVSSPTSQKQPEVLSESSESCGGDELLRGMKWNLLSLFMSSGH
jgi:hypothetical protein